MNYDSLQSVVCIQHVVKLNEKKVMVTVKLHGNETLKQPRVHTMILKTP